MSDQLSNTAENFSFGRYKNKKNGLIYIAIGVAINATNSQDGQPMILYYQENMLNVTYARDVIEFAQKFEIVE